MVVADRMHGGARHLTLQTEQGDLFLVPEWMTQSDAAAIKVVEGPRISVAQLRALSSLSNSILASLAGNVVPGEGGANGDTMGPAARGSFRTLAAGEPTHGDRATKGAGFVPALVAEQSISETAIKSFRRRAISKIFA